MNKIRIGIVGYGNLGRGVEAAVGRQPDMELIGVFSRRPGLTTNSGVAPTQWISSPIFKVKSMSWYCAEVPLQTLSSKHRKL